MNIEGKYHPSDKRRRSPEDLVSSRKTRSMTSNQSNTFLTSLLRSVSQDNIRIWINSLSSFHSRHSKSKYLNQVAEWIKSLLVSFGYTDVYFHNYLKEGYELRNVICHKSGTTDRVILVCAHYDCIMEDINNAEERAPGANDNASGVSVVLEVARLLSQVNLENCVQFVFFSGEEQGLWGSRAYAEDIKRNNVNLHRLINLDMVGNPQFKEKKIIIERDMGNKASSNDQESQDFADFLEQIAVDLTDLQVMLGPIYDSDYMPFEAQGYVVVGIYDGGEKNTSYHSKTDIPSTVNLEYTASVTKIVLAAVINEAHPFSFGSK